MIYFRNATKNEELTEEEQLAMALAESEREYKNQSNNSDSQKESCLLNWIIKNLFSIKIA